MMRRAPPSRPFATAAVMLAAVALTACATGDGPERSERQGEGRAGPAHYPNVFISPAGKPFRAARDAPYPVAAWFAQADANHDGRLTREEMRADALAFFRELDANHDGVIDGSEVANYEDALAPEILPHIERLHAEEGLDQRLTYGDPRNTGRRRTGDNRSSGLGGGAPQRSANTEPTQGAALFSLINEPEPVSAADTEFNGRITPAEFIAAADRRFDILDTKQKGYLTLADLPKTPVQSAIERAARARRRAQAAGRPPPGG